MDGTRTSRRRSQTGSPAARAVSAIALALAVCLLTGAAVASPASAAEPSSAPANDAAEAVIAAAEQYVGLPYRLGTEGPDRFDCSGLVFRAFADAGLLDRIGGRRIRAAGYMRWFAARGQFTTEPAEARRGDLVMYDHGKHIAIYLGQGKALSAVLSGVTVHSLHGLTQQVTGFLRVDWDGDGSEAGPPVDLAGSDEQAEEPAELVPASSWALPLPGDELEQPAQPGTERADMRTAGSRTFEQDDGSFTTELFSRPIFYQAEGETEWQPIDLRFEPLPHGPYAAAVEASPVRIALAPARPGVNLVELLAGEQAIGLSVAGPEGRQPGIDPTIGLDGHYADYRDLFAEGAGMRVFPRADGVKAFVVLSERPATDRFELALDAPGLTPTLELDGSLALRDSADATVARIARPLALSSRDAQGNGGAVSPAAARLELESGGERPLLRLVVSRAYLDRAAYPLYVDLTLTGLGAAASGEGGATFALSSWPEANFSTFQRPEWPAYPELWHGRLPGREAYGEAYLRFLDTAGSLHGLALESATLRIFPYWQFESASSTWVSLPAEAWDPATLTWATRPPTGGELGSFETQAAAWADLDLTGHLGELLSGAAADHGVVLHASEIGRRGWKRIVAPAGGDVAGLEPRLVVNWRGLRPVPLAPLAGEAAGAELTWTHAAVAPAQSHYEVELRATSVLAAPLQSGVIKGRAGRDLHWVTPEGALRAGEGYAWRVRVRYGKGTPWSEWSVPATFVAGQPSAGVEGPRAEHDGRVQPGPR